MTARSKWKIRERLQHGHVELKRWKKSMMYHLLSRPLSRTQVDMSQPKRRPQLRKMSFLVVSVIVGFCNATAADAATTQFFTNQANFNGVTSGLQTIDFEGIVADNGFRRTNVEAINTIDGVVFSAEDKFDLVVAGVAPEFNESPITPHNNHFDGPVGFDSAILYSYNNDDMVIDFSGIGGVTAVGAQFGKILAETHPTTNGDGVLSIFGPDGILDVFTRLHAIESSLLEGNMEGGGTKTFYGFTIEGRVIDKVLWRTGGDTGAIDNLVYTQEPVSVPEPTTFALIWSLLGGIGLVAGLRRRGRKVAHIRQQS